MVDGQQQTTGPLLTRIEPHRLHHGACGRRQPQLGRQRLLADGGAQRGLIHAGDIDAMQTVGRLHGTGRCDLQGPFVRLPCSNEPQPQRIVMLEQRLQGRNQLLLAQVRRHLQQHCLVEALDRPAPLGQPAHDRGCGQCPGGEVRQRRCRLLHEPRHGGQCRDGLMLEHRPRRDHQSRLARPAHQLDRHDAVAAQREEVVVDTDPLEPQHLGEQRRTGSPPAACAARAPSRA